MSAIMSMALAAVVGLGGPVTGVSIHSAATQTEVVVAIDGEVEVRDFLMEGPYRLVLDLVEEVAALLEAMSMEQRQTGVEVTLMRPEPMEAGDFYDRWSYELGVQGSYHNVGAFMAAIASLERIIAAVDMEITAVDDQRGTQDSDEEEGQISARFRIQTYVVSDRQPEVDSNEQTEAGA